MPIATIVAAQVSLRKRRQWTQGVWRLKGGKKKYHDNKATVYLCVRPSTAERYASRYAVG
jgi:hypothetical protein